MTCSDTKYTDCDCPNDDGGSGGYRDSQVPIGGTWTSDGSGDLDHLVDVELNLEDDGQGTLTLWLKAAGDDSWDDGPWCEEEEEEMMPSIAVVTTGSGAVNITEHLDWEGGEVQGR